MNAQGCNASILTCNPVLQNKNCSYLTKISATITDHHNTTITTVSTTSDLLLTENLQIYYFNCIISSQTHRVNTQLLMSSLHNFCASDVYSSSILSLIQVTSTIMNSSLPHFDFEYLT